MKKLLINIESLISKIDNKTAIVLAKFITYFIAYGLMIPATIVTAILAVPYIVISKLSGWDIFDL